MPVPPLYTDPAPSVVQASLVPVTQVVALSGGNTTVSSGSVTATISGAVTVAGSVSLTTGATQIGSVSVSVLPALVASAAQIGSVTVSSLPSLVAGAAQIGSVTVSNYPAVTTVVQTTAASLLMTPVQATAGSLQVAATQSGAPWSDNLTQVGGAALALGQTTGGASLPVTIAVDQPVINQLLETQRQVLAELRVISLVLAQGLNIDDDPIRLRNEILQPPPDQLMQ